MNSEDGESAQLAKTSDPSPIAQLVAVVARANPAQVEGKGSLAVHRKMDSEELGIVTFGEIAEAGQNVG